MNLLRLMKKTYAEMEKTYQRYPKEHIFICIMARNIFINAYKSNITQSDFMNYYPRFKNWITTQGKKYSPSYSNEEAGWYYDDNTNDLVPTSEKLKVLKKFIIQLEAEQEPVDASVYNRLVDKMNIMNQTMITDSKFLQVMINMDSDLANKAVNLINKYGINKALEISKTMQSQSNE